MKSSRSVLSGWGHFPRAQCRCVVSIDPIENLDCLAQFPRVIARGMGRSYGDASLAANQEDSAAVITRWQDKLLDFDRDRGILTAQAGTTLERILDAIIPHGWFLPVTPGTRFVSLGGALAANVHGKNHHLRGAIVKFVNWLDVLTERGVVRCSAEQDAELFYATIGGYGLTGLILRASLRLKKIESAWVRTHLVRAVDLEAGIELCETLDAGYEYSVTWLDALARGKNLGRGIVMLGNHVALDQLDAASREEPLRNCWTTRFVAPKNFPGAALNNVTNHVFNFAYSHRFLGRERDGFSRFESWFYPLDRIVGWNRFYGRNGFVEYQCALPASTAATGMREILERIQTARVGSFLAAYKRISDDGVAMPFAMPGYTLALDFGLRHREIFHVLDELDRIVVQHGGRVCLSKDARLSAEMFREMYPEYPRWRETVSAWAPSGRFASRLSQRLRL